ncbi:MAG: tyrosine--tRNA ligase [Bdellovibrionales bacterium]|nr:tyrosine--tRNA ligase [Bdellovibrionales bacterium]
MSPEEQLEVLKQGTEDFISDADLLVKLKKSQKENKPLRIKAGFDPNRPDIHLGHTVVINKMKQFQDMGHLPIFVVGDFTALIGDPTGKNETRPPMSSEQVKENAETYAKQVFKILDPQKTEVVYNSTWLSKISSFDFIRLASKYTVARMLERDDFSKRYKANQSIALHEFLYPLIQGYDSVALNADVELGGTDQLFNLLVGRDLQKESSMSSQVVITMPLLVGLDGVQKMSKSLDNYISIEDSPRDIFGKTMRFSDELMIKYYELLTDKTPQEISQMQSELASGKLHPRAAKVALAKTFVARFYGQAQAEQAKQEFDRIFVNKGLPDEMESFEVTANDEIWIQHLLKESGLASSTSEGRRLVQGSAVEWDGAKIQDPQAKVKLNMGQSVVLKAGKKKFIRIVSKESS